MLLEIRGLGFEYAELSHGIRMSLLPGILDCVDAGEIKISTVHNFCPLPMGILHAAPNIFQFTTEDRRERENAWKHSLKTIETAQKVGAKLVVLHLGSMPLKDYKTKLVHLVKSGLMETRKFTKLQDEIMSKITRNKDYYQELASQFVTELADHAKEAGVLLGIENREAIHEIPIDADLYLMLKMINHPNVRYWHDCGHAQIKENLGFIRHDMHLGSLSEYLAGFHIHDVQFPDKDHCTPGTGCIDFERLAPMVKSEHIKVFEFSPSMSEKDALAGIEKIKSVWGSE